MNDIEEEVLALSDDGDAGNVDDGDDGTVSPAPATVPKKRGRPSNSEKPKKATPVTPVVRGRGRTPKVVDGGSKKSAKEDVDGTDEEGTASDGGSLVLNGDGGEAATVVASKRGRKAKNKRKLTHTVEATGKGRGRPKKIPKTDDGDDDEAADDNDGVSSDYKTGKKANAKAGKKGRGRPKKVQNSDDENSDDKQEDYERRPVGRPASGGVKLNISPTGKGQGRPKKKGGPKKPAYVSTGKPRGRPKAVQEKKSQDDDDADETSSKKDEKNSTDDAEENHKTNSESDDTL